MRTGEPITNISGAGDEPSPAASVAVVTVGFNSSALILEMLESLRGHPVTMVWIVENGSSATSREDIEALELPFEVVVDKAEVNLGFGGGVNRGVRSVRAFGETDYVLLLNPDATLEAGCVESMVEFATTRDDPFVVVLPLILDGDSNRVWYGGGTIELRSGRVSHAFYGAPPESLHLQPYRTQFATGAAQFMSTQCWDTLGGYREDLFLYWEDVDLSLRAADIGVGLWVVPSAVAKHSEGGTSRTRYARSDLYYHWTARNRIRVLRGRAHIGSARFLWGTIGQILRPLRDRPGLKGIRAAVGALRGTIHALTSGGSVAR